MVDLSNIEQIDDDVQLNKMVNNHQVERFFFYFKILKAERGNGI